MKICFTCKIEKSRKDFRNRAKSSDGLDSYCKECRSQRDKLFYQNNPDRKNQIIEKEKLRKKSNAQWVRNYLKEHPCVACSLSDPDLLEFDHIKGVKVGGVSSLVRNGKSLQNIIKEIEKCQVLCLHCHRKKTIKQFGWNATLV
jgi:hypothetical protein